MSLAHRRYASYEEYVRLQGRKAGRVRNTLLAKTPAAIQQFERDFRTAARHLVAGPVLCLGARTGAEVIAAVRVGFAGSVGIDLHPIGRDVRQGDWHALSFPDGSFPNVYTNSLDHCLFLDRMAAEVHRVLTPGGRFYVMASDRPGPGKHADVWLTSGGDHEALYWDTADDLRDALLALGFGQVATWRSGIWGHYVLTRTER